MASNNCINFFPNQYQRGVGVMTLVLNSIVKLVKQQIATIIGLLNDKDIKAKATAATLNHHN